MSHRVGDRSDTRRRGGGEPRQSVGHQITAACVQSDRRDRLGHVRRLVPTQYLQQPSKLSLRTYGDRRGFGRNSRGVVSAREVAVRHGRRFRWHAPAPTSGSLPQRCPCGSRRRLVCRGLLHSRRWPATRERGGRQRDQQ